MTSQNDPSASLLEIKMLNTRISYRFKNRNKKNRGQLSQNPVEIIPIEYDPKGHKKSHPVRRFRNNNLRNNNFRNNFRNNNFRNNNFRDNKFNLWVRSPWSNYRRTPPATTTSVAFSASRIRSCRC